MIRPSLRIASALAGLMIITAAITSQMHTLGIAITSVGSSPRGAPRARRTSNG